MKKLNVINLYKHNYIYKNIKNINKKKFLTSLSCCLVTMFAFGYMYNVNSVINQSVSVFNPISELYRDMYVASFVNVGACNFVVPIKTEKYKINDDNIEFFVTNSIMVYAPENGIIDMVDNNNKVIKIKHAENIYSVISGVNICGVIEGEKVQQGKEIATAKEGSAIVLTIIINEKPIRNLYLNKSFVKWNQE